MLRFLFPRLTPRPTRGGRLFEALVGLAREPHWYLLGKVPDTIDGRFAILSTIVAVATVRLEHGDDAANEAAAALTERFIEAMDAEHREIGIGDPTLGKTVRKLVGILERRVEIWREAILIGDRWDTATVGSLFRGTAPSPGAVRYCGEHLRLLWARLAGTSDEALVEGRLT